MAETQADDILQQYNQARAYLEQTLEQEAAEKIDRNQRLQSEIKEKIRVYNQAVAGINNCLQAIQVYERQLPAISDEEFFVTAPGTVTSEEANPSLEASD